MFIRDAGKDMMVRSPEPVIMAVRPLKSITACERELPSPFFLLFSLEKRCSLSFFKTLED